MGKCNILDDTLMKIFIIWVLKFQKDKTKGKIKSTEMDNFTRYNLQVVTARKIKVMFYTHITCSDTRNRSTEGTELRKM